MLLLLLLLVVVPIIAFRYARRRYPNRVFLISGLALGSVISPFSLGLYATFFIPYVGLVPGILGLMSTMFHSAPGYNLAIALGIIPSHQVVGGVGHLYLAAIDAVFWATVYGGLGWLIDWARAKSRKEATCMPTANPSINTDWLTAGFARCKPAGYAKRYAGIKMSILPDKRMDWIALVCLFVGLVSPRILNSINGGFILYRRWTLLFGQPDGWDKL